MCHADAPFVFVAGMHSGTRQEEVIDHRLTDREWAEEWKHLDHVRKVITFLLLYALFVFVSTRKARVCTLIPPLRKVNALSCSLNVSTPFSTSTPPSC